MATMKALLLEDVRKLVVRDLPDPPVPPREVLIRVRAVGVCGTEPPRYSLAFERGATT